MISIAQITTRALQHEKQTNEVGFCCVSLSRRWQQRCSWRSGSCLCATTFSATLNLSPFEAITVVNKHEPSARRLVGLRDYLPSIASCDTATTQHQRHTQHFSDRKCNSDSAGYFRQTNIHHNKPQKAQNLPFVKPLNDGFVAMLRPINFFPMCTAKFDSPSKLQQTSDKILCYKNILILRLQLCIPT